MSAPKPMFRKRRTPDPDERVEVELKKVELDDRLADIHDFRMLFAGGFALSLYFFVAQQVFQYCALTPLSWTTTCTSVPFVVVIRSSVALLVILLLLPCVAYICERWRRKAIEEYRCLLRSEKDRHLQATQQTGRPEET